MEEIRSCGGGGKNGKGGEGRGLQIWSPGEGIRLSIACALPIDNSVLICFQGCRPPRMPPGCGPRPGEVFQVFMISVDLDGVLRPLQVHAPLLESSYYCQQLLIVDRIIEFSSCKLTTIEADRV